MSAELIHELNVECEKTLSSYQVPYKYKCVEDFPRTAAGKVDYRKLEEQS